MLPAGLAPDASSWRGWGIVLEEADETEHWLGVLDDGHFASSAELSDLRCEARELRAIFRAALTTARANLHPAP